MKRPVFRRRASGWKKLPKGWTEKSVEKFYKSIGGEFDACVEKMRGNVDNPEAFCASLIDEVKGTTEWRKKKRKKSAVSMTIRTASSIYVIRFDEGEVKKQELTEKEIKEIAEKVRAALRKK